jgi:hypothetical protein
MGKRVFQEGELRYKKTKSYKPEQTYKAQKILIDQAGGKISIRGSRMRIVSFRKPREQERERKNPLRERERGQEGERSQGQEQDSAQEQEEREREQEQEREPGSKEQERRKSADARNGQKPA